MGFNSIHETVVSDIWDAIKDGVHIAGEELSRRRPKIQSASSLARATSGLTLTFPVICTDTLDIETATMVAKAIERKNIALLQMAFSAYNITNATDAVSHLSKFHTNLDADKLTLDAFMDIMDSMEESAMVLESDMRAIREDNSRNCNYTLNDSINPRSLMEFSEVTRYGKTSIIQEAQKRPLHPNGQAYSDDEMYAMAYSGKNGANTSSDMAQQVLKSEDDDRRQAEKIAHDDRQKDIDRAYQKERDKISDTRNSERDAFDRQKHSDSMANDRNKMLADASDKKRQYLAQQLLPSEVKKANEMQPSIMVVNFYVNDHDKDLNIAQQAVAGVKSKLYPVSSADIMNRIVIKTVDSDIMLKLVKVSTREISFVKDFLLGLDQAKLDALSKSRKGSGSALFRALERRAVKGKVRKTFRLDNSAKAISTLVITQEEAEQLSKYNNIDVTNPKIAAAFMEKLNLLYFVIVDTTSECVNIITDGESLFETYSFTALERESGDGAYKKVVKLMSNISR